MTRIPIYQVDAFTDQWFKGNPAAGVDEDPVTGSIHCALTPYWAARLGRDALRAKQCSARDGELHCRHVPPRVHLAGRARIFLNGDIYLDEEL